MRQPFGLGAGAQWVLAGIVGALACFPLAPLVNRIGYPLLALLSSIGLKEPTLNGFVSFTIAVSLTALLPFAIVSSSIQRLVLRRVLPEVKGWIRSNLVGLYVGYAVSALLLWFAISKQLQGRFEIKNITELSVTLLWVFLPISISRAIGQTVQLWRGGLAWSLLWLVGNALIDVAYYWWAGSFDRTLSQSISGVGMLICGIWILGPALLLCFLTNRSGNMSASPGRE